MSATLQKMHKVEFNSPMIGGGVVKVVEQYPLPLPYPSLPCKYSQEIITMHDLALRQWGEEISHTREPFSSIQKSLPFYQPTRRVRSGARCAEIILRLSNEDSNPCQRLLALINSCIYDLARLGVRVLSHMLDKNSFPLPTICSSPIAQW